MKRILNITIILMVLFITFAQISCVYAAWVSELELIEQQEQQKQQDQKQYEKMQQEKQAQQEQQEYSTEWSNKSTNWWKPSNSNVGGSEFVEKADVIVTVIRNIGIVVAVIALMIIGIKEMTASVEEKSVIKQALPGYLLGVIMVVAITTLPSIIYSIVKNL